LHFFLVQDRREPVGSSDKVEILRTGKSSGSRISETKTPRTSENCQTDQAWVYYYNYLGLRSILWARITLRQWRSQKGRWGAIAHSNFSNYNEI